MSEGLALKSEVFGELSPDQRTLVTMIVDDSTDAARPLITKLLYHCDATHGARRQVFTAARRLEEQMRGRKGIMEYLDTALRVLARQEKRAAVESAKAKGRGGQGE